MYTIFKELIPVFILKSPLWDFKAVHIMRFLDALS
jgi:hypothetical protein